MKTLLQIVQQYCKTVGLQTPLSAAGSTDTQIVQMVALLNEGLDSLVQKDWSQLQKVATFTSTGVELQGALGTLASGYRAMIGRTLWSNSNKLIGHGSISPQTSQALRIWGTPSELVQFREVGDDLAFIPAGSAGLVYSFEYWSKFAVRAENGTLKQYFTSDTDTPVLPDAVHLADLRWRWKAEKELAYAELFRTFEDLCKQGTVSSASKVALNMSTNPNLGQPGIAVPFGNWRSS